MDKKILLALFSVLFLFSSLSLLSAVSGGFIPSTLNLTTNELKCAVISYSDSCVVPALVGNEYNTSVKEILWMDNSLPSRNNPFNKKGSDYGIVVTGFPTQLNFKSGSIDICFRGSIEGDYIGHIFLIGKDPTGCYYGNSVENYISLHITAGSSTTIQVYRLSNNQCSLMTINSAERTANDYDTSSLCQAQIVEDGTYLPLIIVGVLIVLFLLSYFLYKRK